MIKFNQKQKKSGFNKHGRYQFGSDTCVYCKSDNTWRDIVIEKGKRHNVLKCACMNYK